MKSKNIIWIVIGIIAITIAFFIALGNSSEKYGFVENIGGEIAIYKSSSCGCCEAYGDYFKSKGNSNTEVINSENADATKNKYGVPRELQSCHTTIIGGYFVEGHIPLEAIDKLIKENPNIAGIAMPGMPSGSPGMPGAKTEDFIIFSVNRDGTYQEFMRI